MAGDCGLICPVDGGFHSYTPNVAGNALFVAAFGLLVPLIVFRGLRYRTLSFATALMVGALLEVVGFVGRILLRRARGDELYFTLALVGTVVGPACMSGAVFLVLPHVLRIHGDRFSPLRPKLVGIVLYSLLLGAVVAQLVGIVYMTYGLDGRKRTNSAIVVAVGTSLQTAALLAFVALYLWTTLRLGPQRGLDPKHSRVYDSPRFSRFLRVFELATVALIAHSIYRIVEMAWGIESNIFQNEAAFMVMNGVLPFIACLLLSVVHPGAAFGAAWSSTSPRRPRGRAPAPAPLQQPLSYRAHHRYDPSIGRQITPNSHRSRHSDPPKVASGSPGLPPNPKPLSKPPSPRAPPPIAQTPPFDQRFYDRLDERPVNPQARKNLVDSEALW
jgi:hypothetical protein